MDDFDYDAEIDALLAQGFDEDDIAEMLNVDPSEVYARSQDASEEEWDRYEDSMDGDHESALASAGWGMDEDYGASYSDDIAY